MIIYISLEYGNFTHLWFYPGTKQELLEDWKENRLPSMDSPYKGSAVQLESEAFYPNATREQQSLASIGVTFMLRKQANAEIHLNQYEDTYLVIDGMKHYGPWLVKEPEPDNRQDYHPTEEQIKQYLETDRASLCNPVPLHFMICHHCQAIAPS